MSAKSIFTITLLFICILLCSVNSYATSGYKHNYHPTYSKISVHTQHAKIDPNTPKYRFQTTYPENVNGDYRPVTVKVFSGDDTTPLQVIKSRVSATLYPELKFKDANFDGFPDMLMVSDRGIKWHKYTYWLFDKENGLFVSSPLAKQMTSTISGNIIKLNKTRKTIITIHDVGPVDFDSSTYKIVDDKVVLIKSIELLMKDEGGVDVTTKKRLNGRLITNKKTIEVPPAKDENDDPVRAMLYEGENKRDQVDSDEEQ